MDMDIPNGTKGIELGNIKVDITPMIGKHEAATLVLTMDIMLAIIDLGKRGRFIRFRRMDNGLIEMTEKDEEGVGLQFHLQDLETIKVVLRDLADKYEAAARYKEEEC